MLRNRLLTFFGLLVFFWAVAIFIPYQTVGRPLLVGLVTVLAIAVMLNYRKYAWNSFKSRRLDYGGHLVLGIMFTWCGFAILEFRAQAQGFGLVLWPVLDQLLLGTIFAFNVFGGVLHLTARQADTTDGRLRRFKVARRVLIVGVLLGFVYLGLQWWFNQEPRSLQPESPSAEAVTTTP